MYYIYVLINKINNKIYVGQTNNLKKRKREHKAKDRLITKATHLYCSINKYGFENFKMILIERTEDVKEVDEAEIFWIKFFKSKNRKFGYNIADGGKVNRGYKHTQEFKIKKSKQMIDYYSNNKPHNAKLNTIQIEEIRNLFLNNKFTTKELGDRYNIDKTCISDIIYNKTYKNADYIPDINIIKDIMKYNTENNKYSVKIRDEFNNIFNSVDSAAEKYKVSNSTIIYHLKNNKNVIRKSKNNLPKFYYLDRQ